MEVTKVYLPKQKSEYIPEGDWGKAPPRSTEPQELAPSSFGQVSRHIKGSPGSPGLRNSAGPGAHTALCFLQGNSGSLFAQTWGSGLTFVALVWFGEETQVRD